MVYYINPQNLFINNAFPFEQTPQRFLLSLALFFHFPMICSQLGLMRGRNARKNVERKAKENPKKTANFT